MTSTPGITCQKLKVGGGLPNDEFNFTYITHIGGEGGEKSEYMKYIFLKTYHGVMPVQLPKKHCVVLWP